MREEDLVWRSLIVKEEERPVYQIRKRTYEGFDPDPNIPQPPSLTKNDVVKETEGTESFKPEVQPEAVSEEQIMKKLTGRHQFLVQMEIYDAGCYEKQYAITNNLGKWRRAFLAPSIVTRCRWAPAREMMQSQVFASKDEAAKAKSLFSANLDEFSSEIRNIHLVCLQDVGFIMNNNLPKVLIAGPAMSQDNIIQTLQIAYVLEATMIINSAIFGR